MIKNFKNFFIGDCDPITYDEFEKMRDEKGWSKEDLTSGEISRLKEIARKFNRSKVAYSNLYGENIKIFTGEIMGGGPYLDISIYKYSDEWFLVSLSGRPYPKSSFYICDGFETLCEFINNSGWK